MGSARLLPARTSWLSASCAASAANLTSVSAREGSSVRSRVSRMPMTPSRLPVAALIRKAPAAKRTVAIPAARGEPCSSLPSSAPPIRSCRRRRVKRQQGNLSAGSTNGSVVSSNTFSQSTQ